MICRRSVQKRLRRKIRSGKDKIVLRSLADMDIIKEKEVLFMNIETIKNAVLKGTRKLDISWYGGEPLLYPEIVESLSRKIK